MTFDQLRISHPKFIYEGFETSFENENFKITFHFLLTPDIKFNPTVTLTNVSKERLDKIDPKVLENLIFNLGMVELISYWKAACPPEILIKAGFLDEEQKAWWKKLLIKGLGEFFYNNKIDFTQEDLVKFVILSKTKEINSKLDSSLVAQNDRLELKDRDLVLVGGGKDSAVTLDILGKNGRESNVFLLNPTDAALKISEVGGYKDPIIIKRTIDPKLLELNKNGYLNGHTPFSAYLAFLSTLASVIYDFKNIVVSNEASSNEGNTKYLGQVINHQYSKSFEFEDLFKEYSRKYLTKNIDYFSFLRPLSELQICNLFAGMEKYHKIFRSCNVGSKKGMWCGICPKCVSTYLTLYPFLGSKLEVIFGKNLLEDKSLIPIVKGLLRGNEVVKPFECVATTEEIKLAIFMGAEKAKKDDKKVPKVLKAVLKYAKNKKELLISWNNENNLSLHFAKLLKAKLLKDKSILVLGLGREGFSVLHFLNELLPFKKIDVSDKQTLRVDNSKYKNIGKSYFGQDYLDYVSNYDVTFKSPGVPLFDQLKNASNKGAQITSSTEIFMQLCRSKIIGVTGTKGKSTTATLIYEVLKEGNINAFLIGNIGIPPLNLLDKMDEDSIIVMELSSYQLENLKISPHIAIITNLYPEHLDYHGSFETYTRSKNNITKFQKENDYLIYNADIKQLNAIAASSLAKKIPFSKKDRKLVEEIVHKDAIPLLGEFNLSNIVSAILVGRLFKIANESIEKAIINFTPLPHRLEFVGEIKGIRFYNDSLSTIPQATIEALTTLRDVETLIAGGYDRGLDYSILGEAITRSKIKNLILFPDTGKKIWQAVAEVSRTKASGIRKFEVDNMKDAVDLAFKNTDYGKIVLLSPASTSFNLFKDYEDRGNQFKEFVLQRSKK